MKETRMLVIDALAGQGRGDEAQRFFNTPADVMRYLWFKKTGFLQLIEPRTIIRRKGRNASHLFQPMDRSKVTAEKVREELRLKYGRKDCHQAASWLNGLTLSPQQACEIMHPKRRGGQSPRAVGLQPPDHVGVLFLQRNAQRETAGWRLSWPNSTPASAWETSSSSKPRRRDSKSWIPPVRTKTTPPNGLSTAQR
jgi:hypothetical protein